MAPGVLAFLQELLSPRGDFQPPSRTIPLKNSFKIPKLKEIWLPLFITNKVARSASVENNSGPFLTLYRVTLIRTVNSTWTGITFCKQHGKLAILFQHVDIAVSFHRL